MGNAVVQLFEIKELTCTKCKQNKIASEFPKDSKRKNGRRAQCKKCCQPYYAKKQNEYYHSHKDKILPKRFWYFKKSVHGVTRDQYLFILSEQNGACAICKEIPSIKKLVIDHNHETKKVRGLLCHKCNAAIGMLKDSITIIRNAASYLEERGSYGS